MSGPRSTSLPRSRSASTESGVTDPVGGRMAPLWLLLVGRAEVGRHWRLLLSVGLLWALAGIVVVVDSLDGAIHVPDRWFGVLLLIDGLISLAVGASVTGTARRMRLFQGVLLTVMAVLILMATRHSNFLLAMIFGIAFTVDGLVRVTIASLLKFTGWRISVALGALSVAFGLFHLQPWPTWYAGTVGYCIGMFLILSGANLALIGLRARHLRRAAPEPDAAEPGSLTVYVWTPTGQATTPASQRLIRRYVASVDQAGRFSTGHAALGQGDDLYISHYPAVEIDRSPANLRSSLRAGPENDVAGRFLPSHEAEVADWCPPTVAVTLNGIDAARLRVLGGLSPGHHLQLHQPQLLDHGGPGARRRGRGRVQPRRPSLATPCGGALHPGILGGRPAAHRRPVDDLDPGPRARLRAGAQRAHRSGLAGPIHRLAARRLAARPQLAGAVPRPAAPDHRAPCPAGCRRDRGLSGALSAPAPPRDRPRWPASPRGCRARPARPRGR
jgi:uncharacterized membrane protein HdeD (DUF308 family)